MDKQELEEELQMTFESLNKDEDTREIIIECLVRLQEQYQDLTGRNYVYKK